MTRTAFELLECNEWERAGIALGLAPQQSRVIALIAQGKPDKQIAAKLEIGYGTLRTYLSRAFEKTGTAGRMELAMKVYAQVIALQRGKEGNSK